MNHPGYKIHKKTFIKTIVKQRYLILMVLPFLIWIIIFKYLPLWGWLMAFQDYRPKAGMGIFDYPFVGLKHFIALFQDPMFYNVMGNTLAMSFMQLIFGFPLPILFAILLNEVKSIKFKKLVQTSTYLPHFVSWVIVAGLFTTLLARDGIVNEMLLLIGAIKEPISFLALPRWFWGICTSAEIWKELGWNSIIFLAAIAGIDPTLYEAAKVDGASRWQSIKHITIPGIISTILVILVLDIGWIISIGFEKQYLLGNSIVQDYSKVLDLYILDYGIKLGRYSFGTAIGIFKSVVSIILLFFANQLAKRWNGQTVI
ncbi:carbohydrate ABC transporter membrane protein 1 (CUT1 family) [Mobilisporobacter senegalensis]|uniref:Carbohydrate ABC transporter membrane protein 1 (CUT1 family) n=2 Tax=Mobilisporobacter senegalensis TaxID=1329262 RepID=A0A3N1XVT4_9FIRM|nr:carbohydrate ABC transporter membrane protein 1 (CUT1 family) [Mobilisporobacter senegalensis]